MLEREAALGRVAPDAVEPRLDAREQRRAAPVLAEDGARQRLAHRTRALGEQAKVDQHLVRVLGLLLPADEVPEVGDGHPEVLRDEAVLLDVARRERPVEVVYERGAQRRRRRRHGQPHILNLRLFMAPILPSPAARR